MNDKSTRAWTKWLLLSALVIITLAAYYPSFWGEFVLDDVYQIEKNDAIQSWAELKPFLATTNRPIVHVSLALNYCLGGAEPAGYHAWNLFVHLCAGLTLFGIVARTLRLPRLSRQFGASADWIAFAITLIWLVHPLQTQSVTYVIQRCESMMGMFYLLTLYCAIRGAQATRPWPWYMAGIATFLLGMGCKEVMATAIVVIPLYDRVFLTSSWREVVQRRWPFYLGFTPGFIWLFYVISQMPEEASAGFGCDKISPFQYLTSQPLVLFHYLRLALLPDQLCLDYGWKPVEHWWQFVPLGAVILAILVACLVAVFRYQSPIGFVGTTFFLILAPTSSIMPIADLAFEHRMYLPLACVITLLTFGMIALTTRIVETPRSRRVVLATALTMVIALFSVRTFVRNKLYTVPLALWSNVLAAAPDNARAHINYGYRLAQNGYFEEAFEHNYIALELAPDDPLAHDNLGRLLAYRNRFDEALVHFRKVQELRPKWGSGHYHAGILLLRLGNPDDALTCLHEADRIKRDHPGCHYRLGMAYKQKGDLEKALAYLRSADRGRPDHLKTWLAMAEILSLQGDFVAAEERFARCLELAPENIETHLQWAEHLVRANRTEDAIAHYREALKLKPDCKPAKAKLAELQGETSPSTGTTTSAPDDIEKTGSAALPVTTSQGPS